MKALPSAVVISILAVTPALAQTTTDRIEPGYDPVDTAAEPAARLIVRRIPVSRLDEQQVYNLRGQMIGEVESIRLGSDGRPYAVIAFDESWFFGLGGAHRLVPLNRMYFTGNRVVLPGVTEEEAENMEELNDRLGYRELASSYIVPMRYASDRVGQPTNPVDTAVQQADRFVTRRVPTSQIDEQNVYNLRGEVLGEIESLRIDPNNQVLAVVAFEEFLGLGGTQRLVPLSRMYMSNDRMILPGVTEAELARLTEWTDRVGYEELPSTRVVPLRYAASAGTGRVAAAGRIEPGIAEDSGRREPRVVTVWRFRDLDGDSNLELANREFLPVAERVYGAWDVDRDQRLSSRELLDGLWRAWNSNGDGRISAEEFTAGWRTWRLGGQSPEFASWDQDNDGVLSRTEFRSNLERARFFGRWDSDGNSWLSAGEFRSGLFGVWDRDRNGVISQVEFNEWNRNWY